MEPSERDARIRLEAGEAAVEVAPGVGGRIAALEVDGWDVLRRDGWTDREWGSFVMAPWAGRLGEARVRWRGAEWTVPATEPPHALHGLVVDVPWVVVERAAARVRCEVALGPAWPFAGRVTRTITLEAGALRDELTVEAVDAPFPVIVGWHPWFRRRAVRLGDGGESGEAAVTVAAGRRVELGADGLPTGRIVAPRDPTDGPLDDALLDMGVPPVVSWPGGPTLRVEADGAAAWIVYTAHPDGVCIEPWTGLPDGLNGGLLGEPPVAAPGAPVRASMTIRWG